MTVMVITTKVRPNTSIDFRNKALPLNKPNWPGYIEAATSTIVSEDGFTEVSKTRWESLSNYLYPNLTDEQKNINIQSDKWNTDNNIQVTINIVEE